jgi:hypothetical protein
VLSLERFRTVAGRWRNAATAIFGCTAGTQDVFPGLPEPVDDEIFGATEALPLNGNVAANLGDILIRTRCD